MLGLVPFLAASGVQFDAADTKVHLSCSSKREHPIDIYYAGRFKEWQEHQGRQNFKCAYVLGLIDLMQGQWLFGGIYRVLGCQPHPTVNNTFLYSTQLVSGQSDLVGRVIVKHARTRQSYVWCRPEITLEIVEIKREKMTIADFPSYNAVVISHATLQTITQQRIASWYAALSHVKGVYLITDTSTGKHYVGKASGGEGIWQRWCAYADSGHGGNVELRKLLKDAGPGHRSHFQYSVLETADTHASDADILARESYWMSALKTRNFGLNR